LLSEHSTHLLHPAAAKWPGTRMHHDSVLCAAIGLIKHGACCGQTQELAEATCSPDERQGRGSMCEVGTGNARGAPPPCSQQGCDRPPQPRYTCRLQEEVCKACDTSGAGTPCASSHVRLMLGRPAGARSKSPMEDVSIKPERCMLDAIARLATSREWPNPKRNESGMARVGFEECDYKGLLTWRPQCHREQRQPG
jgi:hypothetical protein